jgi:hypothetical protein
VLPTTPKGLHPSMKCAKFISCPYTFWSKRINNFRFCVRRLRQFTCVHHTTQADTLRLLLPESFSSRKMFKVILSRQLHTRKSLSMHVSVGYSWWNRRLASVIKHCHNTLTNSYIERLRVAPRMTHNGSGYSAEPLPAQPSGWLSRLWARKESRWQAGMARYLPRRVRLFGRDRGTRKIVNW